MAMNIAVDRLAYVFFLFLAGLYLELQVRYVLELCSLPVLLFSVTCFLDT